MVCYQILDGPPDEDLSSDETCKCNAILKDTHKFPQPNKLVPYKVNIHDDTITANDNTISADSSSVLPFSPYG